MRARNCWFPFFLLAAATLFELNSARCLALTLGEALNATNLVWTTWGTKNSFGWFVETSTTHDGVAAAEASFLGSASAESILQTTVTGPGTLRFWWNNASVDASLSFSYDGTVLASILLSQGWEQATVYIGAGEHILQWGFAFGGTGHNARAACLDEVSFTPGASAPTIATQPLSQSQVPGCPTTFTTESVGTPPLQRMKNEWGSEQIKLRSDPTTKPAITSIG